MKRVCVGIYIHKEPARLHGTLASVRAHTTRPVELLLLPDGPDEQTKAALAILHNLPQVGTGEPLGLSACFNRLVASTDADVLVLLESGSIVTAGWLERLVEGLCVNPSHGLAGPSTNLAWNEQRLSNAPGVGIPNQELEAYAARVSERYQGAYRSLGPLHSLADFCYAVKKEVTEAIGAAEEAYETGPCWEMDYNIRAARAGFKGIWVCGSYVHRQRLTLQRSNEEARLIDSNKKLYQDRFCSLKLENKRIEYCTHCKGDACEHFAPKDLIQIYLPLIGESKQIQSAVRTVDSDLTEPIHKCDQSAVRNPKFENENLPLVSCIMPTYNRRQFVPKAIEYFLRQDYSNSELIIVDDGTDPVDDLVPEDPRIRYLQLNHKGTIGAKRNLACEQANGEIIVHWDDDDWMAPWRVSYQVKSLIDELADICGLDKVFYFDPQSERAWQYIYSETGRPWVAGNTLCYTRAFWRRNPFPDTNVGEDTRFVWSNCQKHIVALKDGTFYVALVHAGNVSPKRTTDHRWRPCSISEIRQIVNEDWNFYAGLKRERNSSQTTPGVAQQPKSQPQALVTAASGIGDVLRITPLIRALTRLGYQVDVLLSLDYLEAAKLLEGSPEIHRLFYLSSPRCPQRETQIEGLSQQTYEVAVFTTWSSPLQKQVGFRRALSFDQREWLREGDIYCVEKIAAALGWHEDLPEPFAIPSGRRFGLPPDTIAFHPGCKADWPWKKWHGFEELAKLLRNVVVIGTPDDLNNANTYFKRSFTWPEHVRNFVGTLNLSDTAALLSECAALVSNDSGIMHLGVALGIPTFGIFGITNPQRETIPRDNMFPVTKGLPCEQACRKKAWGQRNCDRNLECLRTLSAEEVLEKIKEIVPHVRSVAARREDKAVDELGIVYYGYVFDATGYGHAARSYIHALHRAGIRLSVVDLANRGKQVRDELVESLVGQKVDADFHLFHGIPAQWARHAFRLPNAIGMTVWETDVMPTQWRNILSHVLEVWLPCEFNVSTFRQGLDKFIYKLPHPLLPFDSNGDVPETNKFLGLNELDFVFYGLFEWQERKNPRGLIESFLRAFPTENNVVLIIKANPGAQDLARQAVEQTRQRWHSDARVIVRCEAWNEAQIEALHARGDCYVSLHRGEGWCYPLFEAANRGTPIIATGYSGPLDYLSPEDHCLVQYELTHVRQPYEYYQPQMKWAQPDMNHAMQLMRWVYENRDLAKERAARGAKRIQESYSLDAVGSMARNRLLMLMKRTQPEKWKRMASTQLVRGLSPEIPIPPEWYDENYFETGLKSNWEKGYTWQLFADLFYETATFLTNIFVEAASYLDIGCAKGFLVRALRERGKECWGFDHSRWAIDRAEESVKPFVIQASVDDVDFDHQFDVLLALSILESLTESQILSFLSRARAWTRQAIFATIPSLESNEEERICKGNDHDLSHITMKPHQWWHEIFLRAGWNQDSLHKIVERMCQTHAFPKKMGWKIYVYAPE